MIFKIKLRSKSNFTSISAKNKNKSGQNVKSWHDVAQMTLTTTFELLKVTATDPDEGDNGKVTYILGHQPILSGLFYVQPITGEVELKGTLDREELGNVIELVIEATDRGKTPLTCSTVVVVHIEDVNDNVPTVRDLFCW